jgi:hypothetical protein
MAFFNYKPDKLTQTVLGTDSKIDPTFVLFLDAVQQLVIMNPKSFEFKSSYLAFIASELHTNRFFEFIQEDKIFVKAQSLPSVFGSDYIEGHENLVYMKNN